MLSVVPLGGRELDDQISLFLHQIFLFGGQLGGGGGLSLNFLPSGQKLIRQRVLLTRRRGKLLLNLWWWWLGGGGGGGE